MREFNVLVLSAGRRVELIQCFQRAAKKLGIESNIVAADCDATAPALHFADKKRKLPLINDPDYINAIIELCNKNNISLIVPTIDLDLLLLSKNKEYIQEKTNALVMISDYNVVKICRDKVESQRFFENNGYGAPRSYSENEVNENQSNFPLFIKPKSGSSSVNTFKLNNYKEYETFKRIIDEPIIQDYMEGEEYTVDVFLNFESEVITVVPRLRLATRGGEISKGEIVKDKEVIMDVKRLMQSMKPVGHITVQLMKTNTGIKYIEVNPRFGGGAPMSIQSGADSCEYLFRLLRGEKLKYNESYKSNIQFLRYDQSICIEDTGEGSEW